MTGENRTDNEKLDFGGRDDGAHTARPARGPAYPDPAHDGNRPGSLYSPYGASAGSRDTHIGGTQPIPIKKGLFDGISVAQVIAASAAAATSMLLASRIGIAGSVIGAAVSSMVTVICSQLYRNALDASARKLKAKQMSHAYEQVALKGYANAEGVSTMDDDAAGAPQIRIAPTKLQARAAAERSASKRKIAVVSALIAIAAVAASAGIIMLTTSGQGLGTKTPSVFTGHPAGNNATPEADAGADEPIGAPEEQPNPDTAIDSPAKPEGAENAEGTTGTGAEGSTGGTGGGTSGEDGSPQEPGPNTGQNDSASGQADTGDTGEVDGTSVPVNKKPEPVTIGATAASSATLALMAGRANAECELPAMH